MQLSFTLNEDCVVASEEDIAKFERDRGIVLPTDYRAFLSSFPGGSPVADGSSFGRYGEFVAFIYGIHGGAAWKRLGDAIENLGHDLSDFLPVAVSDGGNYFLIRLSGPDRGAIYFRDNKLEGFRRGPTFDSVIRVADSFERWLESLQER